ALAHVGVDRPHLDAEQLLDRRLDFRLGGRAGNLEDHLVVLGDQRRLLGDHRRANDVVGIASLLVRHDDTPVCVAPAAPPCGWSAWPLPAALPAEGPSAALAGAVRLPSPVAEKRACSASTAALVSTRRLRRRMSYTLMPATGSTSMLGMLRAALTNAGSM